MLAKAIADPVRLQLVAVLRKPPGRSASASSCRCSTSPSLPSRTTSDEVVRAADVVVTMGCGDACVYPGKRYEDWEVADPDGQPIDAVRAIRDDISQRVQVLVDSLVPAATS